MRRLIIPLLFAGLAGCGVFGGGAPSTPLDQLAAAETAGLAGDQVILAYEGLPPCPTSSPICQTPEVLGGLKGASQQFLTAITAARPVILASPGGGTAVQTVIEDVTAAEAALAAVVAASPATPAQAKFMAAHRAAVMAH